LIEADEAVSLGLATRVVASGSFDAEVARVAGELTERASSTVRATKALLRRIREQRRPAPADDIVAACYASAEFREGVAAFLEGRKPMWK
jgi:enoyl-CoA hydratase/carnithine racemase